MIRLVHPDKEITRAILASIRAVWPDAPVTDEASEDEQLHELTAPPQRLAVMIGQLQQLHRQSQWPATLTIGPATLNTRTREWRHEEDCVLLTEKEVAVLFYLWQGRKTASREDLLRDVWQYASDADTHTIETHIYRLRQKIENDPASPQFLITTKDGYQLAANASD